MTREEAIQILLDEADFLYGDDKPYVRQAFDMAIEALKEPERKTGIWIDCTTEESLDREWKCSVCNQKIFEVLKPTVYCPMCGSFNGGDEDD